MTSGSHANFFKFESFVVFIISGYVIYALLTSMICEVYAVLFSTIIKNLADWQTPISDLECVS